MGSRDLLIDRERSWLAFNGRVLQEAADPDVPLYERLKFLAIYSSNLDEFFRVRVGALRTIVRLKKADWKGMGLHPRRRLADIHREVEEQQEHFGAIYRNQIVPALADRGVRVLTDEELDPERREWVREWFDQHLASHVSGHILTADETFLENRGLYLMTELLAGPPDAPERHYGLVKVPSPPVPRFLELPERNGEYPVMFMDDVVRANLDQIFGAHRTGEAYAVKLSRDADLLLDDEYSGDLVEKIRESLTNRDSGVPTRFLYDTQIPDHMMAAARLCFGLEDEDLVEGGRYHNFHDLFGFPKRGLRADQDPEWPAARRADLESAASIREAIDTGDVLLHFPYESYDYVVQFINEAARDPAVRRIAISLYRVAEDSAITKALIRAAKRGADVMAFVEVKARFDEASNLKWAARMKAAGVRVRFSMPGLKVHAKVCLVERSEDDRRVAYAYFGTGNFNEKTAGLYTDFALLTRDPRLTGDLRRLFGYLDTDERPDESPEFEHLLVAPFSLRKTLNRLIEQEQERGTEGKIHFKLNSLEDPRIIKRLVAAASAGVSIRGMVRGICCLNPDRLPGSNPGNLPGSRPDDSKPVQLRSIVDRYLEHARVYHFGDAGPVYLSSADWMKRNLSRRIEVAFPLFDAALREQVLRYMDLQWSDNRKARLLSGDLANTYVQGRSLRSQEALHRLHAASD